MAIKALNLSSTRPYESMYDDAKGTDGATVWLIGAIDSRTSGRIKDGATRFIVDANGGSDEVATEINHSAVNYERVQYGLKGFERFRDEKGNDVKFETVERRHGNQTYHIVTDAIMAVIPDVVIAELAAEIVKGNELSEGEVKN